MITCTRRLQWCCGHRVVKHESKCRNPHGHNYVGFFHARASAALLAQTEQMGLGSPELDGLGRVIDFGVLKEKIGGWIDENWDHGFLYWKNDDAAMLMLGLFDDQETQATGEDFEAKSYALPTNPTAENMADHLLRVVCPKVLDGTGVEVYRVVLWETENCFATAEL